MIKSGHKNDNTILIDQGGDDEFLQEQLNPDLIQKACDQKQQTLSLRILDGYDHSYFFFASFIGDHIIHHSPALKK